MATLMCETPMADLKAGHFVSQHYHNVIVIVY